MKMQLKAKFSKVVYLLLFTLLIIGCEKDNYCVVNNLSLNEISTYYDGQWQGITVASDGACYFGSSAHNLVHGGGFFKFDPDSEKIEVIVKDLTDLVGDDINKFTPQGKIHSPIIEIDRKLYLATHLASYWQDVLDLYSGSYFLDYNIDTKEWNNYGIIKKRYSTYSAIEVDSKREKAYTMAVPFSPKDFTEGIRLFEIDLNTKEKTDLGKIGSGSASYFFFLDNIGRVWISMWKGEGSLYCYEPETEGIVEYKNAFPEPKYVSGEDIIYSPMNEGAAWTWLQSIEDGQKCIFAMGDSGGGDERLWVFDPHQDIASGDAFQPLCDIGNTFLSVTLGGDRVYFIQRGNNEDSRNYDTIEMRDQPADQNGHHVNDLHLRSVSLNPLHDYEIIDHGKLIDEKGRTPAYIGSIAADRLGNVYMSGAWLILKDDQGSLQYVHKSIDGKVYGPKSRPKREENFTKKSGEDYIALKRGEFFSWVNVSKDF